MCYLNMYACEALAAPCRQWMVLSGALAAVVSCYAVMLVLTLYQELDTWSLRLAGHCSHANHMPRVLGDALLQVPPAMLLSRAGSVCAMPGRHPAACLTRSAGLQQR